MTCFFFINSNFQFIDLKFVFSYFFFFVEIQNLRIKLVWGVRKPKLWFIFKLQSFKSVWTRKCCVGAFFFFMKLWIINELLNRVLIFHVWRIYKFLCNWWIGNKSWIYVIDFTDFYKNNMVFLPIFTQITVKNLNLHWFKQIGCNIVFLLSLQIF